MTSLMRTWRLAAVAGLTVGAFACSEAATDVVDTRGPELGPQMVIDLSNPAGGSINVNDAIWNFPVPFNVGTGQINPFLSVQRNPNEQGFNTDGSPLPLDTKRPNFTNALPLNHVPTITGPGSALFREIILDANEANSGVDALFSIDRFDLWLCNDPGAATYTTRTQFQNNTADCELVYDIDNDIGGSDVDFIQATDEVTSGSGLDLDYQILIPEANFIAAADSVGADLTNCAYQGVDADPCGAFLILDVRMGFQGGNLVTGSTFEETSTIKRPFVVVSKDADPTLTRTHIWDIEKLVDIALHTLSTGETDSSEYTVNAIYVDSIDSAWAVSGDITIENPSDDDVQVDSIKDTISGVGLVPVVCPMTPPFTIASGATVVCTYSSNLPDGTNRTNTVEVHIQDLAVGTAMADIDFSGAMITVIDETATVTDTFEGTLGGVAAPNDSTFMYTRSFTCDEDEGEYENIATITADDSGTMQKDTANVEVVCLPPGLMIEKTAENDTINAGETARFTITFWNDGPGTAAGATLTDSLPSGLDWSLDSFSPDPAASCAITGAVDSEVLDCGPLDLAPDDTITATVSATTSFDACAVYPNTAIGEADNAAEPVMASDTIVCLPPDLQIDKVAENDTINAGETARFTIKLWNDGPGDAVNATINDPLPAGLTWSLDSYSPDPAAACAVTGAVDSQELDCGPLTLAADDTITATVSATTSFDACAMYPNTATGDADNHGQVEASDTIVCLPPDLQISKTAENDTINAGETARFTIKLWNDGPGDAIDATINDPLPAGLTWSLDSYSPNPAAACAVTGAVDSQELDCGPLTLAPDDTITATVSAPTSVDACAVYPNTATGDADNHGPVEASDTIVCLTPEEDETAWASNQLGVPLVLPYNADGQGSWATYVAYFDVEKTVTFYADQTTDVGTVHFSAPNMGMVTITIMLTGGATFAPGSVVAVQDYSSAPSGNPSPGQFDWKETPDSATMHTITVPQNDFYGVHSVVLVP